ncbi:UNVERIFIED_CONTAM: hypothetical protein Sradi_2682500 [Sesamum radiatum]|uniref:Uncharacterized protein n=1 Tax=Sesamum radiatum TaxID=300843 RepID=A0AAW2S6C3_SESRA
MAWRVVEHGVPHISTRKHHLELHESSSVLEGAEGTLPTPESQASVARLTTAYITQTSVQQYVIANSREHGVRQGGSNAYN